MSQQLVKKGTNGKHENVMPRSWIEAIKDKHTGQSLLEILQGFNMYFLSYNGNIEETRNMVPTILRKKGLWITYVKYDGNVCTEWYASSKIDDKSWRDSSNWRIGNNTLVGDITISANGNWVINGTETEFKAVGEKGNTPLLRVDNNRLQVSYDLGDTYTNVTDNPVYTKFRWYAESENIGRIQSSTDNGTTWTNMSNDFTNNLHIKKYIGVNESLPTSGIAEGTIYAKGPYYAEDDTLNDNPIYRLWVYAWKGNTLAWQDNGEFQSISAGIVQETGDSETEVMSQKAVTDKLSELGSEVNGNKSLIFGDIESQYKEGVFLNANGGYSNISGGACKVTERIKCKEGDVFSYRGRSEYSVAGWIMRNGADIVQVGKNDSSSISAVSITIPSDVDSIQFSSYSTDLNVVLEVSKVYPYPLENSILQLVYTENPVINKMVKTIFIDTSNYNGTLSLNGLYLGRFHVAYNIDGLYYWDFAIKNELGEDVVTNIWRTSSDDTHPNNRFEITSSGIFIYVEYIWENAEKGTTFVKVPLTKYAFDSINDPRFSKSKFTDNDIEGIQQDAYNANYTLGTASVNIINGYLSTSGLVRLDDTLRGKYTSKIPCKEGDIYQYKGVGEYSATSVLFYNNNDIVSYLQINSKTTYTEVSIPSGVNYVVFASYTTTQNADDVILENNRIAPILSYQELLRRINQVNGTNNPLFGKKVGWDGDSVSAGAGFPGGYGNIIAARNNMISQNLSVSGGTITSNTYYNDGRARHWVCESVNNLDSDCDYVIIEGGINDMWNGIAMGAISEGFDAELDSTTFYGALETMIKNLYLRFPGKKMGYVLIHQGASGKWSVYENSNYVSAILKVCQKWGFPLLDLNTQIPPFAKFAQGTELRNKLSAVYTSDNDGCHLNQEGYLKYYCDKIEAWMRSL